MFNDEYNETDEEQERRAIAEDEREQREQIELALIDARCRNFVLGRCSGEAADEGGARYEREMRAWFWGSAGATDAVAASVDGWLRALRIGAGSEVAGKKVA